MQTLRHGCTGLLAVAMLACLFAACTSAEELREDGARLESEGRFEEAVQRYVAAYDKDPTIVDLEDRIRTLGNRVVTDLLAEAHAAAENGQPVLSAEMYMRIDDLVFRALRVGIELDRPVGYAEERYAAFRNAVAAMTRNALDLIRRGDLAGADAVYRDALQRFDPTTDETRSLLLGRYNVLLALAERAVAAGEYRTAVSKADAALAVAERADIRADAILEIRARAIDLGTLYAAAAPVRSWSNGRQAVSPWILAEINDRLELNYWSNPPEFVAMAHGALVRQRIRDLGLGRRPLSRTDARLLALDLDTDVVVLTEVEQFSLEETELEGQPLRARTYSGQEVDYYEVRGKLEYRVLVRITIVARNGEVVYDDHLEQRRQKNFKRAEYDGDLNDLDLSSGERKLFRRDYYDALLTEVEEEIIGRITDRIADRVYDRLRREVD